MLVPATLARSPETVGVLAETVPRLRPGEPLDGGGRRKAKTGSEALFSPSAGLQARRLCPSPRQHPVEDLLRFVGDPGNELARRRVVVDQVDILAGPHGLV